jgi:quercetin dioxygenase-like cupin family protein
MAQLRGSLVTSSTAEWTPARIDGISVKVLRHDKATGESSSLVRFAPGATFPAHDHPAGEEVFVLEGDVRIGSHRMQAGDYLHTPPGGIHAASSEGGCVFLVTLPKPVVIVKDR